MQSGLRCAMNLDGLEQAVKSVLRAMAKKQKILVCCNQGRRDSSSFLLFVIALIQGGSDVTTDDLACAQIQRDSCLSQALKCARNDLEIQKQIKAIPSEMTKGMSHMQTILKSLVPEAINIPECKAGQDSRVKG